MTDEHWAAVVLEPETEPVWSSTAARAGALGTDVDAAIRLAIDLGPRAPRPGGGHTKALWELLSSVAAADLGVARVLEPHLDALAILAEAGLEPGDVGADLHSSWGVFAAEGPGMRLSASESPDGWRLDGVKPWCSLAGRLSNALVTAHTEAGRRLFAVDLRGSGVDPADGPWVSRGLADIVSASVTFDGAEAVPVGEAGWYLRRPGFAWGGIGVAACWWGGAVGIARTLFDSTAGREPDQLALAYLGQIDSAIVAGADTLAQASAAIDSDDVDDPALLAKRVRSIVARSAETTLSVSSHALGPGPLVADERHARRVADLAIYLRQHHAERDDAALGRAVLERGEAPW